MTTRTFFHYYDTSISVVLRLDLQTAKQRSTTTIELSLKANQQQEAFL